MMFRGFAGVWTIVGAARELRAGQVRPVQVAGERVALFRDAAGRASALVDRCPHRGVRLSLGKVVDGCLECPFHGWRFEGSGACAKVPWNPDAKREKLGATALPVRERGGLLWLYTAPGEAPAEPEMPEVLERPGVRVSMSEVVWKTHWTRAMENMLDWPHLPFVHARTIGRDLAKKPGERMDILWEDRPWGGRSTSAIDGVAQEGSLDYRFPNAMHLRVPAPGRVFELMSACVPVDDATTRMIFVTVRDFLKARFFDRFFTWANHRIGAEDREVVESSWPAEVPPAGEERSVRTDEMTLRFRKLYRDRLRESVADAGLRPAASLVRPG